MLCFQVFYIFLPCFTFHPSLTRYMLFRLPHTCFLCPHVGRLITCLTLPSVFYSLPRAFMRPLRMPVDLGVDYILHKSSSVWMNSVASSYRTCLVAAAFVVVCVNYVFLNVRASFLSGQRWRKRAVRLHTTIYILNLVTFEYLEEHVFIVGRLLASTSEKLFLSL
jgi:hypothetical protein